MQEANASRKIARSYINSKQKNHANFGFRLAFAERERTANFSTALSKNKRKTRSLSKNIKGTLNPNSKETTLTKKSSPRKKYPNKNPTKIKRKQKLRLKYRQRQ